MDVFTPHPTPPQMTQMHILFLCTPHNPCGFKLTWTLLPPPNPTPTLLQMTHQQPLKASHAWMNQGNDPDDTRTDCQSCANIKRAVSRAREEFSQLTECAKFGHWLFSYFSWRKPMPSAYNIFHNMKFTCRRRNSMYTFWTLSWEFSHVYSLPFLISPASNDVLHKWYRPSLLFGFHWVGKG